MKKKLLALLFFCSTCILFGQVDCIGGFAGSFPCDNYDLMSNISKSTMSNEDGSDIWGWTDPTTNNEYAIITFEDKTCFVDVTNPVNPTYLGELPTAAGVNFWRDVKVYQNHAFIVADNVGNHGMQVFDLTRLRNVTSPPVVFNTDAHFTDVGSCHNIAINEDTGFAYLLGCNTFNGGPHFVNIQNPTAPVSIGGYSTDGYTHDAQIVTYNGPDTEHVGKEIFIGSNENEIVILDVTTKSSPIKLSSIAYSDVGYTHQGWLSEDHRYFFLGDEFDEINFGFDTRSLIFDFSDLDSPSFLTTYTGATSSIDHNYYVNGTTLYQANYSSGVAMLDISNPNNISQIGFFDTHPEDNFTNFEGAWSIYPYFQSENIIISDINRGLFVIRESGNPLNIPGKKAEDFTLYPNPAKDVSYIEVPRIASIENVKIYNLYGQLLKEFSNLDVSKLELPLKQFPKGLYLVKINNELSKKLIIE